MINTELLLNSCKNYPYIPVTSFTGEQQVRTTAKALIDGGYPVIEVTYRTEFATKAISIIKNEFPAITLGAGTVITLEQMDQALAAGAAFIVSPGYDEALVSKAISGGLCYVPGIDSVSALQKGYINKLRLFKYFPAEATGGTSWLDAAAAPFPGSQFMATGGIKAENIKAYLSNKRVTACGGSWIFKGQSEGVAEASVIRKNIASLKKALS